MARAFVCAAVMTALAVYVSASPAPQDVPPVVVMHGLGGNAAALQDVADWIHEALPNTYVKLAEIGNGALDSLLMDMNKQVEVFCEEIYADDKLKDGFNLIGFSQGGLIARGYIQRCNKYPVINFLSWASPQGGVFTGLNGIIPDWLVILIHSLPYQEKLQSALSFFQYWKDPYDHQAYLEGSTFLADLNNEREVKNETYKENIKSLNSMMLLYSPNDDVVNPPSSGWFDFWAPFSGPGEKGRVVRMQSTPFFLEDWIGLRTLAESGRLIFHTSNCTHLDHRTDACKHAFDIFSLPILEQPWHEIRQTWKALE